MRHAAKPSTREIGDERERAFLTLLGLGRKSPDLPSVRDPDRHIDTAGGQATIAGKRFDFVWLWESVAVELDGGQWVRGGGRHNSDDDRWKTLEAVALGWKVIHLSQTMIERDPVRVLRLLSAALGSKPSTPARVLSPRLEAAQMETW